MRWWWFGGIVIGMGLLAGPALARPLYEDSDGVAMLNFVSQDGTAQLPESLVWKVNAKRATGKSVELIAPGAPTTPTANPAPVELPPAATKILLQDQPQETHWLTVTYTWAGGTKTQSKELPFTVLNNQFLPR